MVENFKITIRKRILTAIYNLQVIKYNLITPSGVSMTSDDPTNISPQNKSFNIRKDIFN